MYVCMYETETVCTDTHASPTNVCAAFVICQAFLWILTLISLISEISRPYDVRTVTVPNDEIEAQLCYLLCPGIHSLYFPGGSDGKESACSAGDLGSLPGLGRSPGEGHDYALQYSFLENSMDRGAWQAIDQG